MKRVTPVSPWMNFLPEPPAVLSANPRADITIFNSSQVKSFGASINLASAFSFLLMSEYYPDAADLATIFSCNIAFTAFRDDSGVPEGGVFQEEGRTAGRPHPAASIRTSFMNWSKSGRTLSSSLSSVVSVAMPIHLPLRT